MLGRPDPAYRSSSSNQVSVAHQSGTASSCCSILDVITRGMPSARCQQASKNIIRARWGLQKSAASDPGFFERGHSLRQAVLVLCDMRRRKAIQLTTLPCLPSHRSAITSPVLSTRGHAVAGTGWITLEQENGGRTGLLSHSYQAVLSNLLPNPGGTFSCSRALPRPLAR